MILLCHEILMTYFHLNLYCKYNYEFELEAVLMMLFFALDIVHNIYRAKIE